ncbi:hypothetical protein L7F22_013499 [Adiantum nelumboides]|nr:hypothetical protein [Adiantum nelumboides]
MACTKQTARKIYSGQGSDRPSSSRTSGKSLPSLHATMKNKRYEINKSVLLELKKLQKHVSLAIPKLPFQRLVRDICEQNNLQFRWSRSGLGCLHEVTEDFLIEFFQDSYVMTAHAHRSTLMPRDFNSLRLLRFRTAHQYGTRLNVELESLRENEEMDFQIEEKRIATKQREHEMAEAHHEANAKALQCLYPFFDVGIFLWGRNLWFRFGHQEVTVLRVRNRELSNLIINFFLCFLVKNLPKNVQDEVAVLNAQLSVVMYSDNTSPVDVVDWFQRVNMDTTKYFLLAYNKGAHWSLILLALERKRCYLANSGHGFHGNVRRSIRKLVTALEVLTQEEIWEELTISSCKVPKQEDGHSCGWRVLLNAELLLQRLYGEEQRSARSLADYTNGHLELYRTKMVENVINSASTRPANTPDAFVPPPPRPAPRPEPRRDDQPPQATQIPVPLHNSADSSPTPSFVEFLAQQQSLHETATSQMDQQIPPLHPQSKSYETMYSFTLMNGNC